MEGKELKILSWNLGYLLGYTGSLSNYLLNPHRAVFGNSAEEEHMQEVKEVIEREDPDIVCLQELDGGSFRSSTDGRFESLASRLCSGEKIYSGGWDNKYDPSNLASSLPFLQNFGNAVLWKGDKDLENHHLGSSFKDLVQEIIIDGKTSIFSVHAPIRGKSRQRYFGRLGELVKSREKAVVCGYFNVFGGMGELENIADSMSMVAYTPAPTFPTSDPVKALDVFLCSEELRVEECDCLDSQVSDHLLMELELAF